MVTNNWDLFVLPRNLGHTCTVSQHKHAIQMCVRRFAPDFSDTHAFVLFTFIAKGNGNFMKLCTLLLQIRVRTMKLS